MSRSVTLEPKIGERQWGRRPMNVDCPRCWPSDGCGFRPTRKGRKRWQESQRLTEHDIKGDCFFCAGTGLVPIPLMEVIKRSDWGSEDADRWLGNIKKK